MNNFQCGTLSDFIDNAISPLDDIVNLTDYIEGYCQDIDEEGCDNDVINSALWGIDTTLLQIREAVEAIRNRF